MVPVAGKPYLEHQITLLARQGIAEIVLLTGYLGEQIGTYSGQWLALGKLHKLLARSERPSAPAARCVRRAPCLPHSSCSLSAIRIFRWIMAMFCNGWPVPEFAA